MGKVKEKLWENKELIVAIVLVLLLLITGSYAWYRYEFGSEKIHIIKAGNLKVVLDDSMSEGILLQNAIPIADKRGLETKAYTFTLENLGTAPSNYTLYLDDIGLAEGEKQMRDDYIKYSLTRDSNSPTTALLSTTGENPNRILESGTINGKEKFSYTLRVWINKDAETDVMGTIFHGKIRVVTESHANTETPTPTGNIKSVVSFEATTCVTGEESTCAQNDCYTNKTAGSCPPGTIVKYAVNDSEEKYFYVLHDDGDTMTLQQRENTVYNTAWNETGSNFQGPSAILPILEAATSNWSNVNTQTYTMGTTKFGSTESQAGCSTPTACYESTRYTLADRSAKARMITVQEANLLGCTEIAATCPIWMYNYLQESVLNPDTHTENGADVNAGYWTMQANTQGSPNAWRVLQTGRLASSATGNTLCGARAVIVIDK